MYIYIKVLTKETQTLIEKNKTIKKKKTERKDKALWSNFLYGRYLLERDELCVQTNQVPLLQRLPRLQWQERHLSALGVGQGRIIVENVHLAPAGDCTFFLKSFTANYIKKKNSTLITAQVPQICPPSPL